MTEKPQFHTMPDGRRIAFRHAAGTGPAIVFLPGYMSDMAGGKATALFKWARAEARECLLFDFSGCGESPGDFADGTLTRWADEAIALIEARLRGGVVLVGSSMGGWLMLLVAEALGSAVKGVVGIAPAPDFTDWGYDETQKGALLRGETVYEDNPYGLDPTPTHARFWADGQNRLMLDRTIAIDCSIRLLHGQRDADVPWDVSLRLVGALRSDDVQVTLIKDGDHRLSREQDIALLFRTVASLSGA